MNDFQVLVFPGADLELTDRLLGEVAYAQLGDQPAIVSGSRPVEELSAKLGDQYLYLPKAERAHFSEAVKHLMVVTTAPPLLNADLLTALAETHEGNGATLTLAAFDFPASIDRRSLANQAHLIVRDDWGNVVDLAPPAGSTAIQAATGEIVAPAVVCRADWFWQESFSHFDLGRLVRRAVAADEIIDLAVIEVSDNLLQNLNFRPELV